jgi:hypothetical protein
MREDLRVRARWNKVGYPIGALTGPLPEGTATDEQVAQRLIAEAREKMRFVVKVAARDVFLGSRPCVYHLLALTATIGEHWWTGIVDGRFVRIAARGETRRQATKYREVITLR